MKSMNARIKALGELAAGNAKQGNSSLLVQSDREPKSGADLKGGSALPIGGDRVRLLSPQSTWNPPLVIGDQGTVLPPLMFQNNTDFVRVKFDRGITGGLPRKNLAKMDGHEVMI